MSRQRTTYSIHRQLPVFLVILMVVAFAAVPGRADGDFTDRIDHLLDELYLPDAPGATVIVVDDGRVVYRGARGMANLELGVPLEPDMVLRLGSITKQFTAAAILLLAEQGKLAVDDPITEYLPDYPVHGHTITIEHLLTHTSGIFSYTSIPGYMDGRVRLDLTTEELIDEFKDREMDFSPGERWHYSNSGYVLLGAIIEKASGLSYAEFVTRNIFEHLGMSSSCYGGHQLIPRRAAGYEPEGEGYRNAPYLSMTQPHAAGALLSTVDDLARWDAALYTDELLSAASRKKLFTPTTLNNGEATDYAYGFVAGSFLGTPSISHGGGIFGFRTHGLRLPEEGVYVAVLSNGSPVSPEYVAARLAALAIGKPFPDRQRADVDPAVLERYVGVYRIDEQSVRTVTFEDGRLYTQRSGGVRLEAVPYSRTGFFYEQSLTHFEMVTNQQGEVTHMLMYHTGSDEPERAEWTDEPLPERQVAEIDSSLLDSYVGSYQLDQGSVLTISRDGERLLLEAGGQPPLEIFPVSDTRYFLKVVDATITFTFGPDGKARRILFEQGDQQMEGKRID